MDLSILFTQMIFNYVFPTDQSPKVKVQKQNFISKNVLKELLY